MFVTLSNSEDPTSKTPKKQGLIIRQNPENNNNHTKNTKKQHRRSTYNQKAKCQSGKTQGTKEETEQKQKTYDKEMQEDKNTTGETLRWITWEMRDVWSYSCH